MPLLRRLKETGIARLQQFVTDRQENEDALPPTDALTSEADSEPLEAAIEVEQRTFASRLEWARYIDEKLDGSGLRNVERDAGLWAWLALYYVEELLPTKTNGRKSVGEVAMWVPQVRDFRRYYRHLLAGPYRIYRAHRDHPDRALILLGGPFGSHGEVVEQFASRLEIVTNRGLIESLTALYWDNQQGKLKKGAGGKNAGSARRLADVLLQFDLTWDLYSLSSQGLIDLLPKEFRKYKPGKAADSEG